MYLVLGVYLVPGGVLSPRGVYLVPEGVWLGVSAPGGVSVPGGRRVSGLGVSGPGSVWSGGSDQGGVSQHALRQPPPPPLDRITDACKNITLAQLRCGR